MSNANLKPNLLMDKTVIAYLHAVPHYLPDVIELVGGAWDDARAQVENSLTGWDSSLVAVRDGQVVGVCCVLATDLQQKQNLELIPWIGNLFVHKAFRNHGIGRQLVTSAIAEIKRRQLNKCYLRCTPDLVQFYREFGFALLPIQPDMGGDKCIMGNENISGVLA